MYEYFPGLKFYSIEKKNTLLLEILAFDKLLFWEVEIAK